MNCIGRKYAYMLRKTMREYVRVIIAIYTHDSWKMITYFLFARSHCGGIAARKREGFSLIFFSK